jgi:hypothetical protein
VCDPGWLLIRFLFAARACAGKLCFAFIVGECLGAVASLDKVDFPELLLDTVNRICK